ncbi:hypothetical protein [Streptomyces sp. NPDC058964]|uniref:hypothetical protein n=1 Tax=Streptomyces sp. NPDC058964 TaxID=3346681 RepID=UPI0036A1FFA2
MRTRTSRLTLAAVSAALLLPLVAAARPPGVPAAGVPDRPAVRVATPMRPTNGNWVVKWQPDDYAGTISSLRTALDFQQGYTYTTLAQLLQHADSTATAKCPRATSRQQNGALYDGVNPANWFCLQDDALDSDARDPNWMPQGISGTSDAHADGTVNGSRAFAFTWHYSGNSRSRVTFLNEEPQLGTSSHKYQHVLFVRPVMKGNKADFENVATHAGGLLWYHDYLLVADRASGLLVFDTRRLWDMQQSSQWNPADKSRIGLQGGKYSTYGYRYVLPLIGQWQTQLPNGGKLSQSCTSNKRSQPCYDYTGLDRSTSPPTMLTGEFCNGNGNSSGCPGQVARWTMQTGNCTDGCLANTSGVARATAVYTQPDNYIQGGISWKGVYYFTASHNRTTLGTLYTDRPNIAPRLYEAGVGVQDLYWLRSGGPQLWSLTEFPGRGKRTLYGVTPPSAP